MGRTPAPAKILKLKGRSDTKDVGGRTIKEPPKFVRVAPDKPADLSPLAAEHWDLVVTEMSAPGLELLKRVDVGMLVMLCECWARWKKATADADGSVTIDSPQGLKKHPAVSVAEAAVREYRSLATQFGLTPASEASLSKMEADPDDQDNPFASG